MSAYVIGIRTDLKEEGNKMGCVFAFRSIIRDGDV